MFFIYILHSEFLNKFYIGQSSDPWKRIVYHNNNDSDKFTGKANYTNSNLKIVPTIFRF